MTAPREELARQARQWATHADEDVRLANHALEMPEADCPYRLVAYHAQQCAEKYLKAYLVLRGRDFPYTHNISRLLELCAEDADWAAGLAEAEELTPYAVTARYPGEDEAVTETEARRAVEVAARVRQIVGPILLAEQRLPQPESPADEGES